MSDFNMPKTPEGKELSPKKNVARRMTMAFEEQKKRELERLAKHKAENALSPDGQITRGNKREEWLNNKEGATKAADNKTGAIKEERKNELEKKLLPERRKSVISPQAVYDKGGVIDPTKMPAGIKAVGQVGTGRQINKK